MLNHCWSFYRSRLHTPQTINNCHKISFLLICTETDDWTRIYDHRLVLEPKTSTSTLLLEFCYTPAADRLDLRITKIWKILTLIDGPCCASLRLSTCDAPVCAWPCKGPERERVKTVHPRVFKCYKRESLVALFERRQHQTAVHFEDTDAWRRKSRERQSSRKRKSGFPRVFCYLVFQVVCVILWTTTTTSHSRQCLKQIFSFTWFKIVPWRNLTATFVLYASTKINYSQKHSRDWNCNVEPRVKQ